MILIGCELTLIRGQSLSVLITQVDDTILYLNRCVVLVHMLYYISCGCRLFKVNICILYHTDPFMNKPLDDVQYKLGPW